MKINQHEMNGYKYPREANAMIYLICMVQADAGLLHDLLQVYCMIYCRFSGQVWRLVFCRFGGWFGGWFSA